MKNATPLDTAPPAAQEEPTIAISTVQVFVDANYERCEGGQPHRWNGPHIEWGGGGSVSCSVCGIAAIDHAMWYDPEF